MDGNWSEWMLTHVWEWINRSLLIGLVHRLIDVFRKSIVKVGQGCCLLYKSCLLRHGLSEQYCKILSLFQIHVLWNCRSESNQSRSMTYGMMNKMTTLQWYDFVSAIYHPVHNLTDSSSVLWMSWEVLKEGDSKDLPVIWSRTSLNCGISSNNVWDKEKYML